MIKLTDAELQIVKKILSEQCPDSQVWAFGSRVKGHPHPYSDLDLAIIAKSQLDWKEIEAIKQAFSESSLSFTVDVIDWHAISEDFQEIIRKNYEILQ